MKPKANHIGQNVAKLRALRGLTQEQLAAKVQINESNMTRQVIANIESGRRSVSENQIRHLAKVFRCSFDDIFLGPRR
ncbi:MAG TPA: helix-turn-helix transcriptional regulator [Candidatus Acidoferrales bacterium]|nr:helix-turn-helix transcriptional regulator [Candidatus Acidoferrales bacterium]